MHNEIKHLDEAVNSALSQMMIAQRLIKRYDDLKREYKTAKSATTITASFAAQSKKEELEEVVRALECLELVKEKSTLPY